MNTSQIKGGASGIQVIDYDNSSRMDLNSTKGSVVHPLVSSTIGSFTGTVTTPNSYSKTQADRLIHSDRRTDTIQLPKYHYHETIHLNTRRSRYH